RQQLPIALLQTAKNQLGVPTRAAAGFMQYFAGEGCWPNYFTPPVTLNNYWASGMYAGALKDAQNIIEQAIAENQPYYRGIARILLAENYGRLASILGEVPFSEALSGNAQLQPAYDTQQEVYAGVQTLLDEAIIDLQQAPVDGGPGTDDLIFGGNAESWIATAYALKARYTMHLSRRDSQAPQKTLQLIAEGAFRSPQEQPNFQWDRSEGAENPLATYAINRPNTMLIDDRFQTWISNRQDPRRAQYMVDRSFSWDYFDANNPLYWSAPDASIPLISYTELMFLQAEALLLSGAPDSEVEIALKTAVESNLTELGVPGTDISTYLDQYTLIAPNATEEEKHEQIITEAYFCYFGMAFQQSWTNFRRTGYPALQPDPNSVNSYNPRGIIPKRMLYPESEQTTNRLNWEAAKMRQGGALLDADTWAFADF
ncbi:MAG: SusD/RagB family nutrient-binding outer membrane lipoprotein, partial [Bacteroidota bacterium]